MCGCEVYMCAGVKCVGVGDVKCVGVRVCGCVGIGKELPINIGSSLILHNILPVNTRLSYTIY